jgi:hypothetical protein
MKCNHCRKPTEYILDQRRLLCKLCNRQAPPNLRAYKCKHRFESNGVFSKSCMKNCGVSVKVTEAQLQQIENAQQQMQTAATGIENVQQPILNGEFSLT